MGKLHFFPYDVPFNPDTKPTLTVFSFMCFGWLISAMLSRFLDLPSHSRGGVHHGNRLVRPPALHPRRRRDVTRGGSTSSSCVTRSHSSAGGTPRVVIPEVSTYLVQPLTRKKHMLCASPASVRPSFLIRCPFLPHGCTYPWGEGGYFDREATRDAVHVWRKGVTSRPSSKL
jgi:hypothetical protein